MREIEYRRTADGYAGREETDEGKENHGGAYVPGAGNGPVNILQENAEGRRRIQCAGPAGVQARAGNERPDRAASFVVLKLPMANLSKYNARTS